MRSFIDMEQQLSGNAILNQLMSLADKTSADHLQRYFKTGKGEYSEGDIFLGVRVPALRKIATHNKHLSLQDLYPLLTSAYHEARLLGVFCLVNRYEKGEQVERQNIVEWYINNTQYINNWDIVDSSAPKIIGHYCFHHSTHLLYELAEAESLWKKRIAIIATYYFIQRNRFEDTLNISKILLNDEHDLIHKACGWMLREVGNRHLPTEENFLKQHYHNMPRTLLRYAIEKFESTKRQKYLKGLV